MSRDDRPTKGSDLGEALAEVAKEQRAQAEAWWDGAGQGDRSALPPGAPGIEALRPLDVDEQAQLAEVLFGVSLDAQPPGPIPLAPRRPRPWRQVTAVVALALAAAVGALFLRPAPRPDYQLSVEAGEQALRGPEGAAAQVYRAGSRFEVVLTPRRAVTSAPALVVFLDGPGGPRPYPGPVERAPTGAFRLIAEIGRELVLPPGEWRLLCYVGPEGHLPTAPIFPTPEGVSLLEHHFRIAEAGGPIDLRPQEP